MRKRKPTKSGKVDSTGLRRAVPFRDKEGRYRYLSKSPRGGVRVVALTHEQRVKFARLAWLASQAAPGTSCHTFKDRGRMLGYGLFYVRRLWLSTTCLSRPIEDAARTLAHEMIHNREGDRLNHGPEFDRQTDALFGRLKHRTKGLTDWGVDMRSLRHTEPKPKMAARVVPPTKVEKWRKELARRERLLVKWTATRERAEKFEKKHEKQRKMAERMLRQWENKENAR